MLRIGCPPQEARDGQKKSRARRRGSSLGRKRPGRAEASATPHGRLSRVRRTIVQAEKATTPSKKLGSANLLRKFNGRNRPTRDLATCCIAARVPRERWYPSRFSGLSTFAARRTWTPPWLRARL